MKSKKKPLVYGVIGGLIAALCCITPLVIVLFGLAGVSMALSFTRYSIFFLIAGMIFVIGGLFTHYRRKICVTKKDKRERATYVVLAVLLMFVIYFIVKYWLLTIIAPYVYG